MTELPNQKEGWEKELLEKVVLSTLREQRRTRLWSIFFRSLAFAYLFILLFWGMGLFSDDATNSSDRHTALIDVRGEIMADSLSSADNVNAGLQKAFKDKNTAGVIIRINSPGGSPVQAGNINDEIRRLRTKHPQIPVYAVVEDICASGGYYIAVAADKIFVDKASIVGSIGVVLDSFGFTGTLEKLGVERRLLTAGENKSFLDPFSPSDPKQREHARKMLGEVHEQFIRIVQHGRGDRLKDSPEIFSGMVWTGQKSIDLGLTDELGSAEYVAREIIKAERIIDYTTKEGLAEHFAKRFGKVATNLFINTFSSFELR